MENIPILLFSGQKDVLVPPHNLKKLHALLPKTVHLPPRLDGKIIAPYVETVYIKDYNHLDIIWGIDQYLKVNEPIREFLRKLKQ
jgi:pimeloyl-ACP methyl ester carboxylesterase